MRPYTRWLQPLKDSGIVEVKKIISGTGELKEFYSVIGRQAKYYRLSPKLCTGEFETVTYQLLQDPNEGKFIKIHDEEWDINFLLEDFRSLSIPRMKLLSLAKELTENFSPSKFQINEQIQDTFIPKVQSTYDSYSGKSSREVCLQKAHQYSTDFIKDEDRFYLQDIDSFIANKKNSALWSYRYAIDSLREGKFFMRRFGRSKNHRLNHNFTCLKSELLKLIMEENDLTELDLSNSQFAFLAAVMECDADFISTPDFEIFKNHAGAGTLYKYLSEELNKTVSEIKTLMMEVSFSSHKNNPANKFLLKQIFPSVVRYMDDYKKKAGDSKLFSIMLLNIEAAVFVDRIYAHLKREGFFCITKHDSLIVKKCDAEYILQYVRELFEEAGFKCNLRGNIPKLTRHEFFAKHSSVFNTLGSLREDYIKYMRS